MCNKFEQPTTLGPLPPVCRLIEIQISPIMHVNLVRKSKRDDTYKVRTLLDTGSGSNWCHSDMLKYVQHNELGSKTMEVQVFEGFRKKSYKYVELFYLVNGQEGTLKCFVTDQESWFNEVEGLTQYAASKLPESTIIDPCLPCDHDKDTKKIALILGPHAANKLRDWNARQRYEGNLFFEPYKQGNGTGYVFSGLLPKHLNQNKIYSYKITPILEEHLNTQDLKRGEIEFETDYCQKRFNLLQNLEFLYSKETLGVKPGEYKETDNIAIRKFFDSVEWLEKYKKYSVGMPFNDRIERLKSNKNLAYARMFQLVRKFVQDPEFAIQYALVINEYIEKYAEEVSEDTKTSGPVCYLPHRAVIRNDSSTTKVRIVFDGSAKCGRDEVCLNDCLMQGPNLVQHIAACLINFRTKKYAFSSDLEKAFLQIMIKEQHRDVLRFLFPSDPLNPLSPLKVYRFKVVIFGANCSPFLLAAVITKHLHSHIKTQYMRNTLQRGIYVDNLFQTRNSPKQMIELFHECRQLFSNAGMNLRTWRSELPELNELAKKQEILEENVEIKVLGMTWNTAFSTMSLRTGQKWNKKYCRSAVLSYANQIYDPLGLIVPVEIRLRVFLQELCKMKFGWEDIFSQHPELVQQWDMLRAEAQIALTKVVPRSACNAEEGVLHVFCDASKDIYGAVAYIVAKDGSILKSELVKSQAYIVGKDKEPKTNTIPKLELMALLVGSNLAVYCFESYFHINITAIYLWGDSRTALSWCSSYEVKEDFVSNRVRKIRNNVPEAKLMYVKSEMNPADILTRQPKAGDFLKMTQWWNGPLFLVNPDDWPQQTPIYNLMPEESMKKEFVTIDTSIVHTDEELVSQGRQDRPDLIQASKAEKRETNPATNVQNRVATLPVGTQLIDDDLGSPLVNEGHLTLGGCLSSENSFVGFETQNSQEFAFEGFETPTRQSHEEISYVAGVDWTHWNSFHEVIRIYARVFAAVDSFKAKKLHRQLEPFNENTMKPLTALNFAKAKRFLIQQMQSECYKKELTILRKGKSVKKGNCRLFGLHLDKHGTIRCKGRFDNSPTFVNINFPVLFGTDHKLTKLLLWNIHDIDNCPGYSYAMHRVKKDMYFPKFKITLRKTFSTCAKCRIHKARAYAYPGNPPLPACRTEARTPYEFTGLDYAGPIQILSHDYGGKMWICVFTCLVTRACHLVMVPNLSTQAFFDALRELSTFYRMPKLLLSDNATQFHSADRVLRTLQSKKVVQDTLGASDTKWHFTPARSSWVGGVFERMIKVVKTELRKMSSGTKLTLQESKVHILEVQRIINRRPLTRATASLDDMTCITPMDLIQGFKANTTIIPEEYVDDYFADLHESKQDLPQQYLRKRTNRENFFKNLNDGYFESLRFSSAGSPQKQGQGQTHRPPKVGDVVLIKEDTLRAEWPMGIITELLVSSDGKIRRAKVMNNKKHVLDRAICNLYALELEAERVIPEYLDSRLHKDDNSSQVSAISSEIHEKPQQRKSALTGRTKISELFDAESEI